MRERKRRAALRVASRLFNEKGYHATSLDEIADRIGVTKTALYYYFRNKEELLYECIEISLKAGERAQAETEAVEGSAFERFRAFYLAFLCHVIEDAGSYATLINIRALPASMQQQLIARRDALRDTIQDMLDEAVAEGHLRQVETESTALFLIGAINWIMAYSLEQHGGSADPEATARAFLDQVLHGLQSR
ncbi:TetR/AcrR family transcriptional regulator [Pseudooceanicola sp. 200-1SW]|uniref:TetR/AcrR family transcriptional regulator n=1 Tax=Pseudooceanicola sp. 200-1SW TaxID=3425949 RepID=UPI003D7F5026